MIDKGDKQYKDDEDDSYLKKLYKKTLRILGLVLKIVKYLIVCIPTCKIFKDIKRWNKERNAKKDGIYNKLGGTASHASTAQDLEEQNVVPVISAPFYIIDKQQLFSYFEISACTTNER